MVVITRIHKNGCHYSQSHYPDLQQKHNATNFGLIFNSNILLIIMDGPTVNLPQTCLKPTLN